MKLRLLIAAVALAGLAGCATYSYSGGSSGYYRGTPSVQYRYPAGYYNYGYPYYGTSIGLYGYGYPYYGGGGYYRPYPPAYRPGHRPPPPNHGRPPDGRPPHGRPPQGERPPQNGRPPNRPPPTARPPRPEVSRPAPSQRVAQPRVQKVEP